MNQGTKSLPDRWRFDECFYMLRLTGIDIPERGALLFNWRRLRGIRRRKY